ncbi:PAS domain S-box protein [bacterium]|nr:PAS domain S-box protein [bacterium]
MKQLNEGNSWSGELLVKRKDGSGFPAFVSDSPIHDQQGKLIGIIGISGDISERKKAEKEINMLADVLKSINECVSITDTENNILFVNDAFVNTYGYTRDELIGQNISIIRPLENPPNALSEILHTTLNGGWQSELWNRRKDGSEFFIHLTTTNIKDSNGQVTALIGVATDITDRKRAEEVLRESEEKYKSFFEDDLTGDYITTLDGRLLACNLPFAKMFGYATVDEALKMDVRSLYPDKKAREQLLKRLTREKRLEYNSSELIRKDGKKIYVIENMVGKFNEKGELIEIKGYLFDDTHRRSLETQLIQSQKMESLGTLAGGIAHDFNNILAIILGHINLVRRKFSDNEYITDSADTITTATQRGASLVKQLLTFARKSDVVLESILIHETIKEIRKFIEQTFPKTISIRTDYEKDLPPVVANPTQIHQVLLNLCINARDAMPNGGILSITAKGIKAQDIQGKTSKLHSPEYIYVKVTDTGTGMDEETKNRIFEPFFTTKGRDRGSGLGLATVYGIVESHHGFIDVQSEVGKGTSFNLYFPVQQSYIEHHAKEVSVNDIAGGNETILIADDEESMRKLLTAIFEEKGYHVLAAADGQEALDMYAQQHDDIALVFTDMGLPKISGEEVIAGIQKINADAKIIISSGYFGHNRKSELLKAGVTDFAQKPYFPDEILKKVREVLDLK